MSNSWLWLERHLARQCMAQPSQESDPTLTMVCFIVGKPEPTAEAEFERYAETVHPPHYHGLGLLNPTISYRYLLTPSAYFLPLNLLPFLNIKSIFRMQYCTQT